MTRSWTRSYAFMPFILKELEKGDAKQENISAICGNRDHRDNTEEEFRKLLSSTLSVPK